MRKPRTNNLLVHSALFLIFLAPASGNALELAIVPRIEVGLMDYEFEQKPADLQPVNNPSKEQAKIDQGYKLSSSMPLLSGGVTTFLNSFFFDVYVQKAFSASDKSTQTLDYIEDPPTVTEINSDFERTEYSISVGYAPGTRWALFGGYRNSTTDFINADLDTHPNFDDEGNLKDTFITRTNNNIGFKQDGYFIGGTYTFSLTDQSVIAVNAAFALLDGKYDSSGNAVTSILHPDGHEKPLSQRNTTSFNFEGDTTGLNLGIAWKGVISNNIAYSLGVNGYSYDFEGSSLESISSFGEPKQELIKVDRTLSEAVLRVTAGLSYTF